MLLSGFLVEVETWVRLGDFEKESSAMDKDSPSDPYEMESQVRPPTHV